MTLLHANAERGRASERFRDVSVGSYVLLTCRYRYMTVPLPSQVAFEITVLNSLRPSDLRYHAWMTCRPVAPHPPDKRIQRHGLWLCDATGAQPRTMRLLGAGGVGPWRLGPCPFALVVPPRTRLELCAVDPSGSASYFSHRILNGLNVYIVNTSYSNRTSVS